MAGSRMNDTRLKAVTLAIAGGAAGAALGYVAFFWLASQGFYALALPGALLGAGAGWFSKQRMLPLGLVCGVDALALGLFTEWRFAPFNADPSLRYFLTHLTDLMPMTWIMLAVGAFCGFWFGQGRNETGPGG